MCLVVTIIFLSIKLSTLRLIKPFDTDNVTHKSLAVLIFGLLANANIIEISLGV